MKLHGRFTATVVFILLIVGIGSAYFGFRLSAEFSSRSKCVQNMLYISGGKGSRGLESRLRRGQRVPLADILSLFPDSGSKLKCPAGGTYDPGIFTGAKDIGGVAFATACTFHGSLANYEFDLRPARPPNPYFTLSFACFVIASLMALAYFATGRKIRMRQASD